MPKPVADVTTKRELGRLLASLRRAVRCTQQTLASLIGYGRGTIANAETDRQNVPRDFWVRCDNALAADGELIEAYDRIDQSMRSAEVSKAQQAVAEFQAIQPTWGDMLRRTVIQGTAALPVLTLTDFSALTRPPQLTADATDDLLSVCEIWRRGYQSIPTPALLRAAHSHLDVALQLVVAGRPGRHARPLSDCIGQMATLTGVLLGLDGGRPRLAKRYLDFAWRVSDDLGDPEMQAVILGARAFLTSFAGQEREALELANHARKIAQQGASSKTRAWVAAIASERYASLGEISRSHRCLDESHTALSAPSDVRWLGIGSFDAAKLAAYEGGNLARLGRSRAAIEPLTRAIEALQTNTQRHLATAYIDRAEAHLASFEFEGAAADASTALLYVVETGHSANFARLTKLSKRMRRHTEPASTAFINNLAAAVAAHRQRLEFVL